VYEADALSSNVYSSTFTPYTSFNLSDTYPPAFMSGYPTAVDINDTTFTLAAAFYEAATVYYVIMPAASVRPWANLLLEGLRAMSACCPAAHQWVAFQCVALPFVSWRMPFVHRTLLIVYPQSAHVTHF